uniref:Uncharacterized protein n=1 Tax=Rhizophagus irregularis (strain DAOM 181602 / DAOM 197198 / MUCL 43194) TaxID=747089 RepID=U9TTH8_RHIID
MIKHFGPPFIERSLVLVLFLSYFGLVFGLVSIFLILFHSCFVLFDLVLILF